MQVEHIEQWIGRDVVDSSGDKIGKLNEVYFDGDAALVGTVQHGRISKKEHLVPLAEASATRDDLRLPYSTATIESVGGPATDGVVTSAELAAVSEAYGVDVASRDGRELEGTRAREERLEGEEKARKEADDLEEDASKRAREAEEARGRADDAERRAREAEEAHHEAERAAADARVKAGRPRVGADR